MKQPLAIVDDPQIEEVLDVESNEIVPSGRYLQNNPRVISELRLELRLAARRGMPRVLCPLCHTAIVPTSSKLRNHFFKHYYKADARTCPYNNLKTLSQKQQDALRYNGLKEGARHRRMKDLVVASLQSDPLFDQTRIDIERRWKGTQNPESWRQPDVRAWKSELSIAFEIQLSSTYIDVIADRREFYLAEGGLLFWLFEDARELNPRQYQEDIFYNNNDNLFIVDEETCELSKERSAFMLRCRYLVPENLDGKIRERWEERIVSFHDLVVDTSKQIAFYFDTRSALDKAKEAAKQQNDEQLRRTFEAFWLEKKAQDVTTAEKEYLHLRLQLSERGISVPEKYTENHFTALLNILYSAKHGSCVGYSYEKFIQVAHIAHDKYPGYLRYFTAIVQHHGTKKRLLEEDATGKWKERRKKIWDLIQNNDPHVAPDVEHGHLVALLFPCCRPILSI